VAAAAAAEGWGAAGVLLGVTRLGPSVGSLCPSTVGEAGGGAPSTAMAKVVARPRIEARPVVVLRK